jgi:ribulose-5-phosphate 4-epimerase/fuculose-1-phosphate aldolase
LPSEQSSGVDLCERVANVCRVLGTLDLTPGTLGHASARVPGTDRILIRARGPAELGVRYTTAEQIIEIGMDGRRTPAADIPAIDGFAVPLEVHIHTELYRSRPQIQAVIHVHPQIPVLLSICDQPLMPIYGAYDPHGLRLLLDGVPTFERSILIDTPALGRDFATVMGNARACIMRGHGITTAANSVEEAALVVIHLNELATMTYRARLLGNLRTLPVDEQEVFRAMDIDAGYGDLTPGIPSGRAASLWRYFERRARDLAPRE